MASTGQGLLGNNVFEYCLNNPINAKDFSGCAAIPAFHQTRDGVLRDGGPAGGAGLLGPLVLLLEIIDVLTGTQAFSPPITRSQEEKTEALVTTAQNNASVYYPADIIGSMTSPKVWKTYPTPMDEGTAIAWVVSTAATGIYGRNASWGLYTTAQADALKMATILGGAAPCLHNCVIGEHPHYHVAGMNLFGQYKHFHIWYGDVFGG